MRSLSLTAVIGAVTSAILMALVLVPFGQVFFRGALGLPFIGAEEFSRFLLICLVFVGYPLVVAADENITMREVRNALPPTAQRILWALSHTLGAAVASVMCIATAVTISRNLNNATPTLNIPFWIFLSATLTAFAGAAVLHVVMLLRGRRRGPQV